MQFNMEKRLAATTRNSLHALPHPRMQSTPGYKSRLTQTCGVHLVVGSDRGQITFPPQMNRSRVCLGPDRDHLL